MSKRPEGYSAAATDFDSVYYRMELHFTIHHLRRADLCTLIEVATGTTDDRLRARDLIMRLYYAGSETDRAGTNPDDRVASLQLWSLRRRAFLATLDQYQAVLHLRSTVEQIVAEDLTVPQGHYYPEMTPARAKHLFGRYFDRYLTDDYADDIRDCVIRELSGYYGSPPGKELGPSQRSLVTWILNREIYAQDVAHTVRRAVSEGVVPQK